MATLTSAMRSKIAELFANRGHAHRSVRAACDEIESQAREINNLRARLLITEADAARFSWLALNAKHEIRLTAAPGLAEVARWRTRYVTYYSWAGETLRDAVDAARIDQNAMAEGARRGVGA